MKYYFILVDYNRASDTVRVQLRDTRGNRPGPTPAGEVYPARVYVKYYRNAKAGVAAFTRYREELERIVN